MNRFWFRLLLTALVMLSLSARVSWADENNSSSPSQKSSQDAERKAKPATKVAIVWRGPKQAIVGRANVYALQVFNLSKSVDTGALYVRCFFPKSWKLNKTKPDTSIDEKTHEVVWCLGNLKAKNHRLFEIEFHPTKLGESWLALEVGLIHGRKVTRGIQIPVVLKRKELPQVLIVGPSTATVGSKLTYRVLFDSIPDTELRDHRGHSIRKAWRQWLVNARKKAAGKVASLWPSPVRPSKSIVQNRKTQESR